MLENSELESPSFDRSTGLSGVEGLMSSLIALACVDVAALEANDSPTSPSSLGVGLGTRKILVGSIECTSCKESNAKASSKLDLELDLSHGCSPYDGHTGFRLSAIVSLRSALKVPESLYTVPCLSMFVDDTKLLLLGWFQKLYHWDIAHV